MRNSVCKIIDFIIRLIDLALTCAISYYRITLIINILKKQQQQNPIYYRMFNKDCR